jgi:hypothetical protein
MSHRRTAGDLVWLRPYSGFVGESHRLRAEIQPEAGGDPPPCVLCSDQECREWTDLLTEPDPQHGNHRNPLCHVSECQMLDHPYTKKC